MNIIAAADLNWGIGNEGQLLDHISEDMKFFKEKTVGKAVIMGRKTFLSLPNEEPLPDRKNFVLTHDEGFEREGIVVCRSIEEAVGKAKSEFDDEDIFFIGGEKIYAQAIGLCDTAYITKIDREYEADRHIEDFDNLDGWRICSEEMIKTKKGIYITFTKYKKI